MSVYDPDDGLEPCTKCGQLTRQEDRVCLVCKGIIKPPKRKSRGGGRKPSYHQPGNPTRRKRNHSFD